MRLEATCGQVRIEARAEHKAGEQYIVDAIVSAAARPRKLIARATLDPDHVWGNKLGRCANGWHVARVVGARRVTAIIYAPRTGLPVAPSMLTAPAFNWWPQVQRARRR